MKKLFYFVFFVLIVVLILSFLTDVSFAKKSEKSWLNMMPGRPPILPLAPGVYVHSSIEYPGVNVSSPIIKVGVKMDSYTDLAAKTSSSILAVVKTTVTLIGNATTYGTNAHTQPGIVARIIGVSLCFASGEVEFSTNWVYGTCDLEGYDTRNNFITEIVVATMTTVTYSLKAFSKITKSVWTITDAALDLGLNADWVDITFNMGVGDKIGLRGNVSSSDYLFKGTVDGTDELSSFTIDAVNDTWIHSDIPDGADDFILLYQYDSEINPR